MRKQYRYYYYRGFDIDLKETTLHNGNPCVHVTVRYTDTQEIYDEYRYWHGEPLYIVKYLVQVELEEYLYDKYGTKGDFIPYAEKLVVRR